MCAYRDFQKGPGLGVRTATHRRKFVLTVLYKQWDSPRLQIVSNSEHFLISQRIRLDRLCSGAIAAEIMAGRTRVWHCRPRWLVPSTVIDPFVSAGTMLATSKQPR